MTAFSEAAPDPHIHGRICRLRKDGAVVVVSAGANAKHAKRALEHVLALSASLRFVYLVTAHDDRAVWGRLRDGLERVKHVETQDPGHWVHTTEYKDGHGALIRSLEVLTEAAAPAKLERNAPVEAPSRSHVPHLRLVKS